MIEVTGFVTFVCVPIAAPAALTVMEQLVPASMVASVKVILAVPATAVTLPPQVDVRSDGVAILKPEGKLSTTATPLRLLVEFGLLKVRVNVVVELIAMVGSAKDFWITGGAMTWIEAVALFPVPPFVDVTGSVVLVNRPAAIPRMSTDVEQDAPGISVIPDS